MDISDACSHEFESIEPGTTLSKVRGAFTTNERARVAVVLDEKEKNRVDRKPEDVRERNASLLEWWLEP